MTHVDPIIKAGLEADYLSEETRIGYRKIGSHCNSRQAQRASSCIDLACTKSIELGFWQLQGNWDPKNHDCGYLGSIQVAGLKNHRES